MSPPSPDPNVIALGIKQPWAELILRGVKTLEVRSSHTQVRGKIYLYASKKPADHPAARRAAAEQKIDAQSLPCGLLVGSVELIASRAALDDDGRAACLPADLLESRYVWQLRNPERFAKPLAVRFLPYGIWFYPFRRRNGSAV